MTIVEVLRHAWSRLIRKQWLVVYPLALSIVDILAFFAVYAGNGESLSWTAFFIANARRWEYVREHFVSGLSFTPALGVAVFAGLAVCAFSAMIRAPYFRAIAGPGYPVAPRNWTEAGRLFVFYSLLSLVTWVLPLAVPGEAILVQVVSAAILIVAVVLVFVDYVIVFEDVSLPVAIRRSLQLLGRRWVAVVVLFIFIQSIYLGIYNLYDLYYQEAEGFFFLLPVSQILVESFLALCADLILIFLYRQIRQRGTAKSTPPGS